MNASPARRPVRIPVPAHLLDHRILDRAVLPAAHALCVMAETVLEETGTNRPVSLEAAFQGFVSLPGEPGAIHVLVSVGPPEGDGGVPASLFTRIAARDGSVSRDKEHLRARFLPPAPAPAPPPEVSRPGFPGPGFAVDREAVYRELVPFGPSFRNCSGPVRLSAEGVSAEIAAPAEHPASPSLGSPYVFDAALHALNVWAQRYRGIVVFPVGYAARYVLEPSRPGARYTCRAVPHPPAAGSQAFDLWILDAQERACEAVLGVRMRELFPGRLRSPAWVRA